MNGQLKLEHTLFGETLCSPAVSHHHHQIGERLGISPKAEHAVIFYRLIGEQIE